MRGSMAYVRRAYGLKVRPGDQVDTDGADGVIRRGRVMGVTKKGRLMVRLDGLDIDMDFNPAMVRVVKV